MDDLSGIQEVQGLSWNKTISKARLSRPASLDGGLAHTETRLSTAGTYLTAPEPTPYPKSQVPLPFEVPANIEAIQKHFDSNLDGQRGTQAQNSVQSERSNADAVTSNNHEILAQGTSKSTISDERTRTSQADLLVDDLTSSVRKLVPFEVQDEYPKRPVSPAINKFKSKSSLNGKTELSRSLSMVLEERSDPVAVLPVPFAVETLYKKLCSSNPSLANFTGSEHSDNLDSPQNVQNRTSETLEGQPDLGISFEDHHQKHRRVVDWVETIPDSPCSDSGSIIHDDLGIFHGRKAGGNETVSVYQRNSNEEETPILGTSARYGNTDFKDFWKKAEAKKISPGPFSPESGHFSPVSSVEVSPRPDGTANSQQKRKSPLLTTTVPAHLKKISESSLTPALKRDLLQQLSASPPAVTPLATSGSARSRALFAKRLPAQPIPLASVSDSSISTELSPEELALDPPYTLGTSFSLDHLRPAPIPKSPTHEDHLHPALRAHPFFNPADHVDNAIAPVAHPPTTRTITDLGPRGKAYFATEESPTLTRDYMESPMRGEFVPVAKEMSTKSMLKRVKKPLFPYLPECRIDDRY